MGSSLDSQAECCGVTVAQCHVLLELDTQDGANATLLAKSLDLDKSTLSRTIDGLVNAGLVDRTVDPASRRQQVIRLTATGRDRIEGIHLRCDTEYRSLFKAIPRTKHAMVLEAVEILAGAIRTSRKAET